MIVNHPLCVQASDIPPLTIRARAVLIGSVILQRVQQCTFFMQAIRITFMPEGSTGKLYICLITIGLASARASGP